MDTKKNEAQQLQMGTYEYFSVFLFDAQLARIVFECQKFSILQLHDAIVLVLIEVEFHTLLKHLKLTKKNKSFSTSKNNDE
jgi:hypothetical protein